MKNKVAPSKEAMALSAAIAASKMTKAAIADKMDVSPGLVSQWASGYRPVPADKASKLGKLLSTSPERISSGYRGVLNQEAGNAVPNPDSSVSEQRRPDLVIARLENDIDALRYALSALIVTQVHHRPAEALDAAAALRKHVPAKFRDRGFVHELLQVLEKARRG